MLEFSRRGETMTVVIVAREGATRLLIAVLRR
jgi:hypothetical protein